ncbi:hypothetical protein R3P38DRAFT_3182947 [Favolaschia claudopus]|uniref:F-box domain-containing protein n=1 Tax=Favolaschia claudopus TaxID=2862362 RepID=A0AAW0CGP5_9AGAR
MQQFPQELVDETLGHLEDEKSTLEACSVVERRWAQPSQALLFSRLTASSETKIQQLASLFKAKPLGNHVKILRVVFPDVRDETFVFLLIDLVSLVPRLHELEVIPGKRANISSRLPHTEFYPPSCFLSLLDGVVALPTFRSLIFVNWHFPHIEIIPLAPTLTNLRFVSCHFGRYGRTCYPGEETVVYKGGMALGWLSVEACSGWDELQQWMQKSTLTTSLSIGGMPYQPMNGDILRKLQSIEVSIDLGSGSLPDLQTAITGLEILQVGHCSTLAVYFEPPLCNDTLTAIQNWLKSFLLKRHQLLRFHVPMQRDGRELVAAEEISNRLTNSCQQNMYAEILGIHVQWEHTRPWCGTFQCLMRGGTKHGFER